MPLISQFYGILIYLYKELGGHHNKPHIITFYIGTDPTADSLHVGHLSYYNIFYFFWQLFLTFF